jgi:hypothetical protein
MATITTLGMLAHKMAVPSVGLLSSLMGRILTVDSIPVAVGFVVAFLLTCWGKNSVWLLPGLIVGAGLFADRGDNDGLWVLIFPLLIFWWATGAVLGILVRWVRVR